MRPNSSLFRENDFKKHAMKPANSLEIYANDADQSQGKCKDQAREKSNVLFRFESWQEQN